MVHWLLTGEANLHVVATVTHVDSTMETKFWLMTVTHDNSDVATVKSANPLNPIVHFWLHHTAHYAEKIVSACLHPGSASAERVGQGR